MTWRIVAAIAGVLIVLAYAGLSGRWVGTDSGWYLSLQQPPWQPPPIVFGLIWPYNFIALIVAAIWLSLNAAPRTVAAFVVLIAISVVFALTWAYQFYVPHNLGIAAVALTLAAIATLPAVTLAFTERWWLGALLLPYQVWLIIAASLSWGYRALNPM